ncbi:MAG: RidA family protein [Rhizobiaceae bacterium]|nr:MAG: RidA family protein [Rhizobiaceae bacterium]
MRIFVNTTCSNQARRGIEHDMTIERLELYDVLHGASIAGDTVYLAGLIGEDLSQDIRGQTRSVLEQAKQLLADAGSSIERIAFAQIFITDMADKPAMNDVWRDFFPAQHRPSRATIGVNDLGRNVRIEVVFTAKKI